MPAARAPTTAADDRHSAHYAALRRVGSKLLGQHHCLTTREHYDETRVWTANHRLTNNRRGGV